MGMDLEDFAMRLPLVFYSGSKGTLAALVQK